MISASNDTSLNKISKTGEICNNTQYFFRIWVIGNRWLRTEPANVSALNHLNERYFGNDVLPAYKKTTIGRDPN